MNICRSQFGWQCAQLKKKRMRSVGPGPRRVASAVVGSAAASFSGAGSAAASSSGAGTDGATSTASRLLFSGLPSEVSSSSDVVVTKKLRILLVPATALSSRRFFSRFLQHRRHYKRGRLSDGYITMKLNKTPLIASDTTDNSAPINAVFVISSL